jgi:hypothetical protein
VTQHFVAAAAYAGMVLAAAAVAAAECRGRRRALRGARQLLIAWVVGATLLAGVSQRDLWPLSSWSLMTRAPRRDMGVDPVYLRLLAVDDAGREYPVDYRAVEPFAIEGLRLAAPLSIHRSAACLSARSGRNRRLPPRARRLATMAVRPASAATRLANVHLGSPARSAQCVGAAGSSLRDNATGYPAASSITNVRLRASFQWPLTTQSGLNRVRAASAINV